MNFALADRIVLRSVGKGDPVAQRQFIHTIFGIAA